VALLGGTTTGADCALALWHLLSRRALIEGPALARYEQSFAERIGVRHAISFASARVGFYGLLQALGVGDGDEVLLPVPTHIVVANAVRYTGARPVYVDCDPRSYTMDLSQAEVRVTPRTKMLLLQHTFGIPSEMDAALALARRHGLHVIEDCVHALGARYRGRPVGGFGVAGFFSSEETKTISTTMGGMVVTDDAGLAESVRAFQTRCAWPSRRLTTGYLLKLVVYHVLTQPRVHGGARWAHEKLGRRNPLPRATNEIDRSGGRPPHYEQRLANAQAALGLRQLERLDANLAHRRRVAARYASRLSALGFFPPSWPQEAHPALVRYPVRVDDRESVIEALKPIVGLGTWFTSVLEEADSPAHGDYEVGSCPTAEDVARHLVNLPTHQRVSDRDVETIVAALAAVAAPAPAPIGRARPA